MIDDNTPEDLSNNNNVDLIDIEKEMKSSFLIML